MREKIKRSLVSIGGENIQVNESKKSLEKRRKHNFINVIEHLKFIYNRADFVHKEYGIGLFLYEDAHYKIIENLIIEMWGDAAAEVVFWWVYDVIDPKKKDYYVMDEKNKKKYIVRTPIQVYNTLKKLKIFKKI